jgi:hypothetical protein
LKSFKVSNSNLILEVGGWGLSNLKTGCCSIKRQAKLQYDETSKNNIKERKKNQLKLFVQWECSHFNYSQSSKRECPRMKWDAFIRALEAFVRMTLVLPA